MSPPPPASTLFPYTTLFRSVGCIAPPILRWEHDPWQLWDDRPFIANPVPHESRSEEHTSELQSHSDLVCRLLLAKKNNRADGVLVLSGDHASTLRLIAARAD